MSGDDRDADGTDADGTARDETGTDGEGVTTGAASDDAVDEGEHSGGPPVSLSPAGKSSLLWAAIGALGFLVLIQGFELWSGERVSFLVKFAVAAVVALVAGGATYVLQGRVSPARESA
jgi:hypothetical protein